MGAGFIIALAEALWVAEWVHALMGLFSSMLWDQLPKASRLLVQDYLSRTSDDMNWLDCHDYVRGIVPSVNDWVTCPCIEFSIPSLGLVVLPLIQVQLYKL